MIDDSLQNKKTDSVNRANMGLKFVREACKYVNMSTLNINCKNPDEKAKRNTLNSKNKKSEGFTREKELREREQSFNILTS